MYYNTNTDSYMYSGTIIEFRDDDVVEEWSGYGVYFIGSKVIRIPTHFMRLKNGKVVGIQIKF